MLSEKAQDFLNILFQYNKLCSCEMNQVTNSSRAEFMALTAISAELKHMEENQINQPGVKVSTITKKLKHSMPATSKMLNGLEESGYVERITSKEDRRAVYISLTKQGYEKVSEITNRMDEFTNTVISRLGDENSDHLIELLHQMYEIMNDEMSKLRC